MLRESSWGTYCGDEAVVKLGELTSCCIADLQPLLLTCQEGQIHWILLGRNLQEFPVEIGRVNSEVEVWALCVLGDYVLQNRVDGSMEFDPDFQKRSCKSKAQAWGECRAQPCRKSIHSSNAFI